MKRIFLFIIIIVTISINFISCKKSEAVEQKRGTGIDTVAVKVMDVQIGDITINKDYTASFEGSEHANVIAKLPERYSEIKFKVGDYVQAGQLVATLDKAGASTQYYQSEAAFKNAERDLGRMAVLLKEGAISQQMYDGVQTQFEVAKANFEAVKSMINITAPISGIVTAVNCKIGDVANPALPLMSIAQIRTVQALFNVGESEISFFAMGKKVMVGTEAKPELKLTGTVNEIARTADAQSRTFIVKANVSNSSDNFLKPGMFGKITVELTGKRGITTVPNSVILSRGDVKYVFTVNENIAKERIIKPGITDGNNTEISEGLQSGDKIIFLGLSGLTDNTPVRVQAETE